MRKGLYYDEGDTRVVHPHIFQFLSLVADYREIFFSTGVGAGKTSWAAVWLSYQQALRPKQDVIWAEPTAGMIERVGLPAYLTFVEGTIFEGKWKNKKMGIYSNMFGNVYFVSAENPEHIQGIHASAAVMDEAGQCRRKAYQIIKGRIAASNGRLLALTNPYHNKDPWLYKEIMRRWKDKDPELLFLSFPSIVNPAFNRSRYEEDKKRMTKEEFEFQYLGIYSKPTGLVFTYDDDIIKDVPLEEGRTYAGMDFGVGDPTVMEIAHYDKNGLHFIDEYYRNALAPSEHVDALANLIRKYKISVIFYDPSAKASMMDIRKGLQEKGIEVLFQRADNDIERGIKAVKEMFLENKITISPNCYHMLDEDNGYVYGNNGMPIAKNDHCEDARRYLIMGLLRKIKGVKHTPPPRKIINPLKEYWDNLLKKKEPKDWLRFR